MEEKFGKDYFMDSKVSNYRNYREKKFDNLADDLIEFLPLRPTDTVLDIGCATGGLMFALKCKGISLIKGMDHSLWAVSEGRQMFGFNNNDLQYYSLNLLNDNKDWVLILDVLEHMPNGELERVLKLLSDYPPNKGVVVRIPVSKSEGMDFALEVSQNDKTHIQIHDKNWWISKLGSFGFEEVRRIEMQSIYDSEGVFCAVFKKVEK